MDLRSRNGAKTGAGSEWTFGDGPKEGKEEEEEEEN